MRKITFNEWQEHLTKELQKNYRKLKLIQNKASNTKSFIKEKF